MVDILSIRYILGYFASFHCKTVWPMVPTLFAIVFLVFDIWLGDSVKNGKNGMNSTSHQNKVQFIIKKFELTWNQTWKIGRESNEKKVLINIAVCFIHFVKHLCRLNDQKLIFVHSSFRFIYMHFHINFFKLKQFNFILSILLDGVKYMLSIRNNL